MNPANIPAPSPIVPKEPILSVTLLTTERRPFKLLTAAMIASEFVTFATVLVQVLDRRFKDPSHELTILYASAAMEPAPSAYS